MFLAYLRARRNFLLLNSLHVLPTRTLGISQKNLGIEGVTEKSLLAFSFWAAESVANERQRLIVLPMMNVALRGQRHFWKDGALTLVSLEKAILEKTTKIYPCRCFLTILNLQNLVSTQTWMPSSGLSVPHSCENYCLPLNSCRHYFLCKLLVLLAAPTSGATVHVVLP